MVGDIEDVVPVDEYPARPAELLPRFEKFSVLVEDLDAVVPPITNKESAARIHGQRMRRLEVAGSGPLLPPRLDERALLRELHHPRVRVPTMAVPDEDVAVRCDEDRRWHVEHIGAIAGDSGLAKRHQDFAVRTQFENLVTLSISPGILSVGPFPVSHPDVAVAVHMNPV